MIEYNYETDFRLDNEIHYADWISRIIKSEGSSLTQLSYIFCSDEYLLKLNQQYLNHDTLTDVITFDYAEGGDISGDIFISTERVKDNAKEVSVSEGDEMRRVMAHGLLHLLGYNDKTNRDSQVMREKEHEKMRLFHVEQ